MVKIIIGSFLLVSFSSLSTEMIKPINTPSTKYNKTEVLVDERCINIHIIEQPDNVLNILSRSKNKKKSCILSILHKGQDLKGEIIYVKYNTGIMNGQQPYDIEYIKTIPLK